MRPVQPTSSPGRGLRLNVDGVPLTPRLINNSIESESNHHWMGLVVLAMGLLALLARTGKAPWAEYWPLLLIGIAIFIFLQADTECWPVGWKSFGRVGPIRRCFSTAWPRWCAWGSPSLSCACGSGSAMAVAWRWSSR